MVIVSILSFSFYYVPKENITTMYCLQIAIGLALGPKSPIVFSMYADTADYSLWKTGRRATAMIFSAAAFAQKLGGAFAGAMMGWVLASLGYVANQVQDGSSEQGIVMLMTIIPAIFAFISVGFIWLYPLTDKDLIEIQNTINTSESLDKDNLEKQNA
jgi:GPH family glycoside/pentoside/hexuronide:cation symporter